MGESPKLLIWGFAPDTEKFSLSWKLLLGLLARLEVFLFSPRPNFVLKNSRLLIHWHACAILGGLGNRSPYRFGLFEKKVGNLS